MRFMPLASEISMGAMDPKKSDGINDDTREMRAVASYTPGRRRRICVRRETISDGRSGE
jgi:hypothetical protein